MSLFLLKTLQCLHLTPRESRSPHNGLGGPSGLWFCLAALVLVLSPPAAPASRLFLKHRNCSHLRLSQPGAPFPVTCMAISLLSQVSLFWVWPSLTTLYTTANLPLAPTIPSPLTCFSPWHLLIWGLYFKFHKNKDLFSPVDCCICRAENNAWRLAAA